MNIILKLFKFNKQLYQSKLYCSSDAQCNALKTALKKYLCCPTTIPVAIGKNDYRTKDKGLTVTAPYNKYQDAYRYFNADINLVNHAIESSLEVQNDWLKQDFERRLHVISTVAKLAAGKFKQELNAAMICGSAYPQQEAENETNFMINILTKLCRDASMAHRKFDQLHGRKGFWTCVTPFNSPSMTAYMISSTLVLGNSVIWKPSPKSLLTNWVMFQMFREAGIPEGALNFVPTDNKIFNKAIIKSKHLAGVNFIGKKHTYCTLFDGIKTNIKTYTTKPRIIAGHEGKNFMFIDPYSDLNLAVRDSIISAFSFSGQKFSSSSILFCPQSKFCEVRDLLQKAIVNITVNHPVSIDENTFMSAVIDQEAFSSLKSYIDVAKANPPITEILAGGHYDDKVGNYIAPTLILCKNPDNQLLQNVILGPLLTIFVYEDAYIYNCMDTIARNNTLSLSASIFSQNEEFVNVAKKLLSNTVYNVHVNRPTILMEGEQFICEHPKSEGTDKFLLNFRT